MKIIWKFLTNTSNRDMSKHRAHTIKYEDLCM